jgi:tRNA A37 threonylcarbamoyladenosine biosynthesis protein TsaE
VGSRGCREIHVCPALIRARLGDPEAEVPSPTFTLVQTYGEGPDTLWHADLYRLSHPDEVAELGILAAMEEASA